MDHNYAPAIAPVGGVGRAQRELARRPSIFCSRWSRKRPQDAKAQLLLATAYLAERQPENALAVYRQMAKVFPNNPEVPRLMGVVYEQQGNAAEARTAFEQSLALSPDYLPTLERITALDVSAKRYDDARKAPRRRD